MYVLCSMETMVNHREYHGTTQLAAIRVDEQWKAQGTFSQLICPQGPSFHVWSDPAYTGYKPTDFLMAPSAYWAMVRFREWLKPDDVLCWWDVKTQTEHMRLYGALFKCASAHREIALNRYFQAYLADGLQHAGSVYKLCEAREIEVQGKAHCALDDVHAIRTFLKNVQFPQEALELRPPKQIPEMPKQNVEPEGVTYPYVYEPLDNRFHRRECPTLTLDIPLEPFEHLSHCLKRGFDPCPVCVRKEVLALRRTQNKESIARSKYRFVYARGGKVFHKRECALVLGAQQILGAAYFYTCFNAGMRPCRICRPLPLQRMAPDPKPAVQPVVCPPPKSEPPKPEQKKKPAKISFFPGSSRTLSAEEIKALERFAQAQKERLSQAEMDSLTQQQRKDHLTLTQPGLAFFAGTGYRTFHLRSCSMLKGMSDIKGFATFEQASAGGRKPCRYCRPTNRADVKLSIPISNMIRENESEETLAALCLAHGYPYRVENGIFSMETPVGRWKIYAEERPVRVDHINLVMTPNNRKGYHRQPRLFLSLKDTFDYILQHDKTLEKESDKLAEERRCEYAHCIQG